MSDTFRSAAVQRGTVSVNVAVPLIFREAIIVFREAIIAIFGLLDANCSWLVTVKITVNTTAAATRIITFFLKEFNCIFIIISHLQVSYC